MNFIRVFLTFCNNSINTDKSYYVKTPVLEISAGDITPKTNLTGQNEPPAGCDFIRCYWFAPLI